MDRDQAKSLSPRPTAYDAVVMLCARVVEGGLGPTRRREAGRIFQRFTSHIVVMYSLCDMIRYAFGRRNEIENGEDPRRDWRMNDEQNMIAARPTKG